MGKILLVLLTIFFIYNLDELVINDNYEFNSLRIEYGSYQDDGYLSIYDLERDEYVNEVIYDDGFLEENIYLAEVSKNSFIVVCKRNYLLGENLKLHDYILLKYNLMGELLASETISKNYTNFYNHHQTLVLEKDGKYSYLNEAFEIVNELDLKTDFLGNYCAQHQGDAFINGEYINELKLTYPGYYEIEIIDDNYTFIYSIVLKPDIIIEGDLVNNNYYGEIKIFSFGELYLNEELYQSGKAIKAPGRYKLEVKGENNYVKVLEFCIYPYIYYYNGIDSFIFDEDKVINKPIRIYSSVEQLYINNEVYNNEIINQPGRYNLNYQQNGIEENIEFIIYPRIEGVKDNNKYNNINIFIFGEAYINDELYSGKVNFNQPGKYIIKLYFENEVYKTINFEIISNSFTIDKVKYIKYGFVLLLSLGGVIFFWKK